MKSLLMDFKTANDLLNQHIFEAAELLNRGNNLYESWGNNSKELLEDGDLIYLVAQQVVNFMAKSSIDSPPFMRIALNSLFKVCTFDS